MDYLQVLYVGAALVTIVGVPVAVYKKYLKRKSEKEKKKNKKMEIRKIILKELDVNDSIINETKDWIVGTIEALKKPLEGRSEYIISVPKFKSSIKEFPENTVYEHITGELSILGEEEIKVIMYVYKYFRQIKRDCEEYPTKFNAPEKSNKDIIKALEPINEKVAHISHFFRGMKESYDKLFEGKIDEEVLEKRLSNLY